MNDLVFSINPLIQDAINNNKPVVALESTIISHGMPYPENVQTALNCEKIIKDKGAIPATIAILDGVIKIGLTNEEIEKLGKLATTVNKVSTRDIPYIVSKKLNGATTVSATSFLASKAGIKVFATGGIGGVHRKAETTMDISADLEELSDTNICVVCAGCKSILDIPKTMEYLETKRVEVIGYQTDYLPAFYTKKCDTLVNHRLDTPEEIALLLYTKWSLNIKGGVLVTNPIPDEYSMDEEIINKAINDALIEMDKLNIIGNKTTPFLLSKIKDITEGNSLNSNIKLVFNNCSLASDIAINLSKKYV